jgi:hypothetical protein
MMTAWELRSRAGLWLACLIPVLVVGCKNVDREADRSIAAQAVARPEVIVVHDFAITPGQVTPGAGVRTGLPETARSATEQAIGEGFADAFATSLVEAIRQMGLPAQRAGAPLPSAGYVLSIEGQFVSLASDQPEAPGIVGFGADWPNAVADIQVHGTPPSGEQLFENLEFSLADVQLPPEHLPSGALAKLPAGAGVPASTRAELEAAAEAVARAAAQQLAPFFADHRWIAPAVESSAAPRGLETGSGSLGRRPS